MDKDGEIEKSSHGIEFKEEHTNANKSPKLRGLKPKTHKSEVGSIANARNKTETLKLDRSLSNYDKQCSKAVKSIEFAQRSFLDNLQARKSKAGRKISTDVWFSTQRRGSSPVLLTERLRNAEVPEGTVNARNINRLFVHRHSLPTDSLIGYGKGSQPKTEASAAFLGTKPYTKSRSFSNLEFLKEESLTNFQRSGSLPKLDPLLLEQSKRKAFSSLGKGDTGDKKQTGKANPLGRNRNWQGKIKLKDSFSKSNSMIVDYTEKCDDVIEGQLVSKPIVRKTFQPLPAIVVDFDNSTTTSRAHDEKTSPRDD
ncbi:uncharacterized protein LOC125570282 [Nematostella vectensis]|uniref:uncharacterized protein LOC125570282 n=1 Tax=Nematostella vectensis TaxID=45351 RepID=UPI002076F620|nr:uncharacterized protein LOC125570282 [Nematostella vectensis]